MQSFRSHRQQRKLLDRTPSELRSSRGRRVFLCTHVPNRRGQGVKSPVEGFSTARKGLLYKENTSCLDAHSRQPEALSVPGVAGEWPQGSCAAITLPKDATIHTLFEGRET